MPAGSEQELRGQHPDSEVKHCPLGSGNSETAEALVHTRREPSSTSPLDGISPCRDAE